MLLTFFRVQKCALLLLPNISEQNYTNLKTNQNNPSLMRASLLNRPKNYEYHILDNKKVSIFS